MCTYKKVWYNLSNKFIISNFAKSKFMAKGETHKKEKKKAKKVKAK